MYTENSINLVREANLVEVIGKYVDLKRAGANYKGKSPFIQENTPSFMVSPVKHLWKDFASGEGGNDAISFVMRHDGVNFPEAVRIIAGICNIHLEEEELTEEQKKAISEKDKLKALNNNVAKQYCIELSKLKEQHWAKQLLQSRGYTQDEIINFKIGFTPGNLVCKAVIKNAMLEHATTLGLVINKKGTSYDFFYNRVLFPIQDINGQVVGFGGRCAPEEDKQTAKYLNSRDSIVFNKSNVLYGLHQARKAITKTRTAILVEGYTDVITMHQHQQDNTVATCGTALTTQHAYTFKKYADHVIVFRDNDGLDANGQLKGGVKAALKDVDILLKEGLRVSVVIAPEGEDPDTLCKTTNIKEYIEDNIKDGVYWKASLLLNHYGTTPTQKAKAFEETIETLACIDNEIIRNAHAKEVAKLFAENVRMVKSAVKKLLAKQAEAKKKSALRNGYQDEELRGLPKGADKEEFLEKGYCTIGNSFWVRGKEGWIKASNFKLTPLFHVEGDKDTARLFDVVNTQGSKSLIDMESSILLNFTANQSRLLDYDYYMWNVELSPNQFKLIMSQLIKQFIKVKPFSYFGWQTKGFWAFANGVFFNEAFHEVNQYGIITVDGLEEVNSDYYNNTPHFYSPAFNITNKFKEDNLDLYQNDRAFIYKESPVSFDAWAKQLKKVYAEKAAIALGFCVATCFKDFIINRYNFFPHLFCTGEKGSGKSKFSDTISSFFTHKQQAFDLNSGTMVGFSRRLERGKNTASIMEEYHDKIDDRMFQSLKGAYDGRGREIGMMTNDSRTKTSNVYSSLVIVGQYLSSRDDNSLTSRSIIQHFIKPTEQYTDAQLDAYNVLKAWEETGITSLVLEIVQYRGLVEQQFHEAYSKNLKRFKKDLKEFEYQERMLMNYCAIYTPLAIIAQHFSLPFTTDEYYTQCYHGIIDNSDLIIESEGLSDFWKTIEKLAENARLQEDTHYKIDTPIEETIQLGKGKTETFTNTERKRLLYLRLNSVHQDYVNEVSKRDGVEVIGEGTLRNYFKSKRYFIGAVKAKRFSKDIVSSCYLFDYDMLMQNGIIRFKGHNEGDDADNPFVPEGETAPDVDVETLFTGRK